MSKRRKSQLEQAIDSLEAKRDVLDLAIAELRQQQKATVARPKPRVGAKLRDEAGKQTPPND